MKISIWKASESKQPLRWELIFICCGLFVLIFEARGAADRGVESLRFQVSMSEDSGFKSYPSRPEVYLVKNVVR